MEDELQTRLVDLEVRFMAQAEELRQLGDVVLEQRRELDALRRELQAIKLANEGAEDSV